MNFGSNTSPEVLQGVVPRLIGQLGIGRPALLELVEQQLVSVGQIQPKPLVQNLDDLRQRLEVGLEQLPDALAEDGLDLALVGAWGERALGGHLGPQVRQLDLRSAESKRLASGRRPTRARYCPVEATRPRESDHGAEPLLGPLGGRRGHCGRHCLRLALVAAPPNGSGLVGPLLEDRAHRNPPG